MCVPDSGAAGDYDRRLFVTYHPATFRTVTSKVAYARQNVASLPSNMLGCATFEPARPFRSLGATNLASDVW